MPCHNNPLRIRRLGRQPYQPVWQAMKTFTEQRHAQTADELWLVEHEPVFTLGQAGKIEHVLTPGTIPVIQTDRGGQVTYHGPGQLVCYLLLDIQRQASSPRALVTALETAVMQLLNQYDLDGHTKPKAPGVYVAGAKIASLGLRFTKRGCYHGLSLNVDMGLAPFQRINPCGYPGQAVTSLKQLLPTPTLNSEQVEHRLLTCLLQALDYSSQYLHAGTLTRGNI